MKIKIYFVTSPIKTPGVLWFPFQGNSMYDWVGVTLTRTDNLRVVGQIG